MYSIKKESDMPRFQEPDDEGYVEHIVCNGSRRHVLHYDTNGCHCSIKNCEINKPKEVKRIACLGGIIGGGKTSQLIQSLKKELTIKI